MKTIEIVSSQSPNKRMDPTEDVGRAQLQKVIDDLADVFIAGVAANRGVTTDTVLADFGQGGVFVGRLAVEQGLADAVGTYESTLAELRDRGLDAVTVWRTTAPSRATLTTLARDLKMSDSTKAGDASSSTSGAPTDPATPPATATTEPVAAVVAAPDLIAQARAEAATQERERIASIRTLGASADAALVEKCVADGVTAEAAARCFLEADQAKAAARLLALKGDESSNPAPAKTTAGNGEPDSDRAKAKEILAVHATVAPSRSTTHRSR
ncbi:MAG: S49 family peptidase [Gemmatimonadaceae bacterium]|nr:S49 family peptidase [Gemmatimonadaceae bacterium]